MSDPFYRAFEDRYRGSRELIKARLTVYRPFVEPLLAVYKEAQALDLGCGRGEWLELLTNWGFSASGIDTDVNMLSACRELGLNVQQANAVESIRDMPAESQTIVSAFHLVEHLSFEELRTLVTESIRVLKPGGLLIIETPNPESLVVSSWSFYLDPTHQRPVPSQLLAFVAEHAGFARVKTLRLQESKGLIEKAELSLAEAVYGASPDCAVIAQKAATANVYELFEGALARRYGLSQNDLLNRWDRWLNNRIGELETQIAKAELRTAQAEAVAAQAENNVSMVDRRLQQLSQELLLVYGSRSWRITSPLRQINKIHGELKTQFSQPRRRLLNSVRNQIRRHESLKRVLLRALERLPHVQKAVFSLFDTDVAYTNVAYTKPSSAEFAAFIAEFVQIENPAQFRNYQVRQHIDADYDTLSQRLLDRCAVDVDMHLIEAMRQGRKVRLLKTVSNRESGCLVHLVTHIYLAMLRIFPREADSRAMSQRIIELQNIEAVITLIRPSRIIARSECQRGAE